MGRYGEICNGCGGEDCACCEVFHEYQADQRAAMDYGDEYFYDEYDDYPDGFDYDDDGYEDDYDPDAMSHDSRYADDEREHDTPLGDLYGNGFED